MKVMFIIIEGSLATCRINMSGKVPTKKRVPKWYFGGLAATGAAFCTHPLDLLKVLVQTQQEGKPSMMKLAVDVVKKDGFIAFCNGLPASMLSQITISTIRFGLYEAIKQHISPNGEEISFPVLVSAAGISGAIGGFIGSPITIINVRMQNDLNLPPDQRRNYRHLIHGLRSFYHEENCSTIFSRSAGIASIRTSITTIGQLPLYDQSKIYLLKLHAFDDDLVTQVTASFCAGTIGTTITHPIDVIKTRMMSSKPGEYKGITDAIRYTAKKGGSSEFFKSLLAALIRSTPQTVLLFLFLEQLTVNFGTEVRIK